MRHPRAFLLTALAFLLLVPAACALIKALTPVQTYLKDSQLILLTKVEKVYPERPGMVLTVAEDLKGKAPFRKMAVNLTGDREGKKTDDTARLLKRVADGMPIILFVDQIGERYIVVAFSNGTWFQIVRQGEGAWSFTHLEPYLRRTFKGSTAELSEIVKGSLAGKIKPPEVDPKEKPGIGPEVEATQKEKGKKKKVEGSSRFFLLPSAFSLGSSFGLFAVIPTLGIGGPLAILALLFPSLFGGVLVLFRQWAAFFTVISVVSLFYMFHWLFGGNFRDSWWVSAAGMIFITMATTFLCALWSWRRNWMALAKGEPYVAQQRTENIVLMVLSLVCLVIVLLYKDEHLAAQDWNLLVGLSVGIWAATAYKLYRGLLRSNRGVPLPSEGIMLWTMLFTLAGLAAGSQGTGQTGGLVESEATQAKAKFVGKVWDFQVPRSGCIVSTPFVASDRVYFASAHPTFRYGVLHCLDRASGKQIWQFTDKGALKQVFSSPTVADNRLYIGEGFHDDNDCKVYCIDTDSGKKVWDFQTTSQTESSPFIKGDRLYVGGGNDGLYCLDATSGKKLWQFPETPKGRLLRIGSGPVLGRDGKLFVGSGVDRNRPEDPGETALLCIDTSNGKSLWKVPVNLPAWGSPAINGDQVFFGLGNGDIFDDAPSPAGAMLSLDAGSGKMNWRTDMPNGVLDKPAVDQEHVYFGCRDGHCYCLDRSSGKIVWKKFLNSPVIAAPALARSSTTGKTASVYVLASRGTVCCLDPTSGEMQWSYKLEQFTPHLSAAPSVVVTRTVDGDRRHLYFGAALDSPTSGRAVLYCLEDLLPH